MLPFVDREIKIIKIIADVVTCLEWSDLLTNYVLDADDK